MKDIAIWCKDITEYRKLTLVEDWYNSLSPEDRYLLIKARCDEERAKTRAAMEGGSNIE